MKLEDVFAPETTDIYNKNSGPLTTDEWIERFAKILAKDIKCHIDNSDEPVRYIMMSIRNWIESGCVCKGAKISIMGKGGYACADCGMRRLNGSGK